MGKNRFVKVEVERLPLSDGDWIEIKKELNTGDEKKLSAAGLGKPVNVDGRVINPIDWARYELERAAIFLVDWSFRDANDKPVELSMDAMKALDVDSFTEINQAILTYTLDRATEKKARKEAEAKLKLVSTPPSESETSSDQMQ